MKRCKLLVTVLALCSCAVLQAQSGQGLQKVEQLAKQLNLTPQQELQLVPILKAEAPKVEAIKSDTSLTNIQKMEQLRAVHNQTDPKVKSILTPQQYEKLQAIRRNEVRQAIERKLHP